MQRSLGRDNFNITHDPVIFWHVYVSLLRVFLKKIVRNVTQDSGGAELFESLEHIVHLKYFSIAPSLNQNKQQGQNKFRLPHPYPNYKSPSMI